MKSLLSLVLLSSVAHASPITVKDCDQAGVDLRSIVQPVQTNSISLYGGKVVAYNVDVIDPVCCSKGVAIVLPDVLSPFGDTKCVAVLGYFNADVIQAAQTYSPMKGLLLDVPIRKYSPSGFPKTGSLKLRINLRDSSVVIE